ncbi:MAG TPA: alkaline phosphatase family protein, partial [Acetobacteraceae bacterium]|nr:alkaline phosphatase family protein [Acetobacteraceae bacterium]
MAPIERIVVLMMENHAFDRVLGWTTALHPGLAGVHPAHPLANPDYPSGPPVFQAPTRARNIPHDPGHDLHNVIRQIDGGANAGFITDYAQLYPQAGRTEREQIMAWYPRGALPALHALAEQFVVADHWFSSMPGPTWPNRFFAHTGTSLGHVDMPEGIFSPGVHWYDQRTLYDELSDA